MSLDRFVSAQAGTYGRALEEVQAGNKCSHWMWYIFPQLRGLGRSAIAGHYGIADIGEARSYLAHPVLGPRLTEIAGAMLAQPKDDAAAVLGAIDAMKLRSCATLFEAAGGDPVFAAILARFYGGVRCVETLGILQAGH